MKNKILCSIITVAALGVTSLCTVSPSLLLAGCGNGTLASYKLDGPSTTLVKKNEISGGIYSLSESKDQEESIVGTDQGLIYKMRNSDFAKVLQCENHTNAVLFVNYPGGVSDKFASCSQDGSFYMFSV